MSEFGGWNSIYIFSVFFLFKIQSVRSVQKCTMARIGPWPDLVGCQ